MNLIEKWFGVSPDGGSGSLEAILLILLALVCAFILRARIPRLAVSGRRPTHRH
jgi:hypothetical protein